MKNLYYFFYGFISALFAFVVFFDNTAYQLLDDYYIELLNKEYNNAWIYTKMVIVFSFIICCIIWIYLQGLSAATEIAEQIKKEKENENDKFKKQPEIIL